MEMNRDDMAHTLILFVCSVVAELTETECASLYQARFDTELNWNNIPSRGTGIKKLKELKPYGIFNDDIQLILDVVVKARFLKTDVYGVDGKMIATFAPIREFVATNEYLELKALLSEQELYIQEKLGVSQDFINNALGLYRCGMLAPINFDNESDYAIFEEFCKKHTSITQVIADLSQQD